MNSKQQDTIQFYKQIEAEINKRIHARTNSRAFTKAVGKALDSHLREVRIYKRLTTRWLNRRNLATKDEFAALANRKIEVVEEIDSLDESIYQIINLQKANQQKLTMVRESLEEWSTFLNSDVTDQRSHPVKTLENELQELKKLFEMDIY
ncbi:hypothetical protein L1999_07435 [Neobacillus drentensis]|uniref:hypothetical protein n=1 Tax=Neobacillus drentensis TaxID=220684 RepID=UPI001F37068D|nr:hypothetical protein [Neobacillus drentensis]ULT58344.1 hypothetical protein L1999_07435 [Neobacillus drentensis]